MRRTRYRGFCFTAMNSAIFAAAHESLNVPWNTARRWCAITAILLATSFRKLRLWLTTSNMPGYVCRAAATISWLSMSRWFVGSSRSEEHTSELQSRPHLVCRLLLEKKKAHKVGGRSAAARPRLAAALLAFARSGRAADPLRQRVIHGRARSRTQCEPGRVPPAACEG